MIAFIIGKNNLVPSLEGLWSSNQCTLEFAGFWSSTRFEPTTSELTVLRSYIYIHIYTCVCIYTYIFICSIYIYIQCMYICICMHIYVSIYGWVLVQTFFYHSPFCAEKFVQHNTYQLLKTTSIHSDLDESSTTVIRIFSFLS